MEELTLLVMKRETSQVAAAGGLNRVSRNGAECIDRDLPGGWALCEDLRTIAPDLLRVRAHPPPRTGGGNPGH